MAVDINKFSFAQMTSNSNGKTSASGTMGVLCVTAGVLGFLAGVLDFFKDDKADIMTQSIVVITIGAGLLGYRKSKDGGSIPPPSDPAVVVEEKPVDTAVDTNVESTNLANSNTQSEAVSGDEEPLNS